MALQDNPMCRQSPTQSPAGGGGLKLTRMSSLATDAASSPSASRRALVTRIWSSFSPADRAYLRSLSEMDIERYSNGQMSMAFGDPAPSAAHRSSLSLGSAPHAKTNQTSIFSNAIQKKTVGGNWRKAFADTFEPSAKMRTNGKAVAGRKKRTQTRAQSNWNKARSAMTAATAFVSPGSRPLPNLDRAVAQASQAEQSEPEGRHTLSNRSNLKADAERRRLSAQSITASFRRAGDGDVGASDPDSTGRNHSDMNLQSIRSISSKWERSEQQEIRELAALLSEADQDEIAFQILTQRAILLGAEEWGRLSYLQAMLYPYLPPEPYTLRARRTETIIMWIVALNVISMIVSSEDEWFVAAHRNEQSEAGAISLVALVAIQIIEYTSFVVFVVEYILRVWVCTLDPKFYIKGPVCGRLKFMMTKSSIVDLIALVPSILEAVVYGLGSQSIGAGAGLRLWRVARILKLENYARAFVKLQGGFSKQKKMFKLVLVYPMVALIVFATVLSFTETQENGADEYVATFFTSIPRAMFPVLLMLSGEAPLVDFTPVGQFVVMCISLFSVLIVATATGILASGFEQAVKENEGVSVVLNEARRQLRKHIKAQVDRDTKRLQKQRRQSRINRGTSARRLPVVVREERAAGIAEEHGKPLTKKGSMARILGTAGHPAAPRSKMGTKAMLVLDSAAGP